MDTSVQAKPAKRYGAVSEKKAGGATYTPKILSDFIARQIVTAFYEREGKERPIRILDPAVGDGELLVSLLDQLTEKQYENINISGFETNKKAFDTASKRLKHLFPKISIRLMQDDFLAFISKYFESGNNYSLFQPTAPETFDLIIANPPYVRTQIMGAEQARKISRCFGLKGRVDLYHAFILGMAKVLKSGGIAGIIVSNRFMTTKSGSDVRRAICGQFDILHIWDMGDTKLFDAAVLPAVLLLKGCKKRGNQAGPRKFTSVYETTHDADECVPNPVEALSKNGVVESGGGLRLSVQHGTLDTGGKAGDVWRIATQASESWIKTAEAHTWGVFRDIGKIRVGVKTCADKVFIRSDWEDMVLSHHPELLRSLTTHHIARRFKADWSKKNRQIVYPHHSLKGKQHAVNLKKYPRTQAYLSQHRETLEGRKYVMAAGRNWYEVWVPQNPELWNMPKLVFRDITKEPTFWIDLEKTVVNGDCYWLICEDPTKDDLLWLALAIGNSEFIKTFYDYRFHNKLYAGRRRFISQYVEKFPLPNPAESIGKKIIETAKRIYNLIPSSETELLEKELNRLVWRAFGLPAEEIRR